MCVQEPKLVTFSFCLIFPLLFHFFLIFLLPSPTQTIVPQPWRRREERLSGSRRAAGLIGDVAVSLSKAPDPPIAPDELVGPIAV